ncbi:Cytochrome c-type biogenesis protein CcmE [Thermus sp. CCB_US3_UF1]|uniref:cytochrome c maturation protein CcmE n=1 Tax=unclassified Thermus TaxID=2619321 RepID=UPI000238A1EA|nr:MULTISPECIES: cytochrome c maturation protein CcmE [unclassified Thermus]AEV15656.1 Cytochrome c-type biogenesis protein CcmE [Thermus sp. CCB_US3_UF1]MCS6868666.1 cytochrome c maturation protein CcmE [Thermus sp.]MCX7849332.1 cytochrome c maturation protein CcmE [Thermus sp.]MDW8017820.1 cytochrome c maturation protein CcmE [Thermus sp.]MDW8357050.1 cytochrome c maturation protein CcmE [Thermus sp.]
MRTKYVLGVLLILGALAYMVFGGLGRNLVYFLTPSEYLQDQSRYQNRPVRLGGLVKEGTVRYDKDRLELRFTLTDGVAEVPVVHRGTPPGMFKEGQGVVVEGRFREGVFQGSNLLVKHSESYQAPKAGWTPEEVRKLIEEAK